MLRKKKTKPPLFHFLDDNAKPWSKRCDFVVFWCHRRQQDRHFAPIALNSSLGALRCWLQFVSSFARVRVGVLVAQRRPVAALYRATRERSLRISKFLLTGNKANADAIISTRIISSLIADPSM